MSVIGQEYKQPRVLAHDAVLLTLGKLTIDAAGTGYNGGGAGTSSGTSTTTVTGVGVGLTLNCTTDGAGIITAVEVNNPGVNYVDGDEVTVDDINGTGGGSCDVTITFTGLIPNTTKIGPNNTTIGSCLYVGGAGTVRATLESENTVDFIGVNGGSFLPVMATHVHEVDSEGASNILALY